MEDLAYQRAAGDEVGAGEFDRQLDQLGHARAVGRGDAGQVGRHVREHDVDLARADPRLLLSGYGR